MSDQLSALAAQYGGAPVGSAAPAPDFTTSNVPVDVPRDARGRPQVSSDLHDGPPTSLDQLNEMLGPLAHPQTLLDFARLLGVGVDPLRKAAASALAMNAATSAVKSVVSGGARLALKGAAAVGDVVDPDVVGVISPRAGKVIQIAQKLRDRAAAARPTPVPAAAVPPTIGEAAAAAPAAAAEAAPAEASAAKALDGGPVVAHPSPQQVASEAAITARRAAYQARQAAAASAPTEEAPAWTPTKIRLTAEESKVAAKLIQQGKTDAEVQQAIEAARAFQQRYGTPTPTAAEQRFAKGTRGGAR